MIAKRNSSKKSHAPRAPFRAGCVALWAAAVLVLVVWPVSLRRQLTVGWVDNLGYLRFDFRTGPGFWDLLYVTAEGPTRKKRLPRGSFVIGVTPAANGGPSIPRATW